jgi:hypothetical protein
MHPLSQRQYFYRVINYCKTNLNMKQILIVGAGHQFPQGPFDFLQTMIEHERVHVRGLFFRPVDQSALAAAGASNNIVPFLELEDDERKVIAQHKSLFAHNCEQHHIPYSLHNYDGEWDKDLLIKESRFADLILISGECFYAETDNRQPNQYLRQALHDAECPVLVIPEYFAAIRHVYLAYDGSRESIFAIKQFCYLFPYLADLPTEFVYVHEDAGQAIPELEHLQQFGHLKFDYMNYAKLQFNAADHFAAWICGKKNVLLVAGSFGRSKLSYIGKRSFTRDVIHNHEFPVFIAHT